jgi:hypothetical protein
LPGVAGQPEPTAAGVAPAIGSHDGCAMLTLYQCAVPPTPCRDAPKHQLPGALHCVADVEEMPISVLIRLTVQRWSQANPYASGARFSSASSCFRCCGLSRSRDTGPLGRSAAVPAVLPGLTPPRRRPRRRRRSRDVVNPIPAGERPAARSRSRACRCCQGRGVAAIGLTEHEPLCPDRDRWPGDRSKLSHGRQSIPRPPDKASATTGSVSRRKWRRFTRGPRARRTGATCTNSMPDRARSADCTGISRPLVPRPVPRRDGHRRAREAPTLQSRPLS